MADIHAATSTYDTGTNDTYTAVQDMVDDVLDNHQNGPSSAIIAIETILGTGPTLKGSAADLVARLAVALESSGKIKDFSATTKTTFPPTTAEGCLGDVTANYTASQLVRKHATLEKIESTGYTVPGASGVVVSEADTQTLTNKTLTSPTIVTPTIASFTNATHNHLNAAGGGTLGTDSIGSGQIKFATGSFVTSSFDAQTGITQDFTAHQYMIGGFTLTPSSSLIGTCRIQFHRNSGTGATANLYELVVGSDGGPISGVTLTVSWTYITTV